MNPAIVALFEKGAAAQREAIARALETQHSDWKPPAPGVEWTPEDAATMARRVTAKNLAMWVRAIPLVTQ